MQRRSFLSGILAAPAIVHSESLMKLCVPKWHRGGFAGMGVVYLNGSALGKTSGLDCSVVFDAFVTEQLRRIADSLHMPYEQLTGKLRCVADSMQMPYEQLIADIPGTHAGYSSARIALQQGFNTPLSRPLSARFSNGHSPS